MVKLHSKIVKTHVGMVQNAFQVRSCYRCSFFLFGTFCVVLYGDFPDTAEESTFPVISGPLNMKIQDFYRFLYFWRPQSPVVAPTPATAAGGEPDPTQNGVGHFHVFFSRCLHTSHTHAARVPPTHTPHPPHAPAVGPRWLCVPCARAQQKSSQTLGTI